MGSIYLMSVVLLIILSICVNIVVSVESEPHHHHRHSRSSASHFSHLDRLLNRLDKTYPSSSSVVSSTAAPTSIVRSHRQRAADSFADFDDDVTESSFDTKTDRSSLNSLWDNEDDDLTDDLKTTPTVETAEEVGKRWSRIMAIAKNKQTSSKQDEIEDDNEEEEEEEDEEEEEEDENEDVEDDETLVKDTQADTYDKRPHWAPRQTDYSSWKWENMGNKKSVDQMFQVYRSGLLRPDSPNVYDLAQYEMYKHNKLVSRETLCKVPRPKVIRVSDVYPSTSKLYVPACTVLHQCGDDTGCCSGTAQRCGPKYTKRVELYFYTTYMVSSHSRQRTSSSLEKLPFYNHTECECQDKLEEMMPRDSGHEYHRNDRITEPSCKCPSEYTVRHLANGSCSCDCFDKQRDCIKYKKGKEYFNHQDRLCIEMGTCQLPSCDFGVYLRRSGRCPRKHEKFRSWSPYH